MKLVTQDQDQDHGCVATIDNYDDTGSPIGSGRAEQDATQDLLDILEDDSDYAAFVESVRRERGV